MEGTNKFVAVSVPEDKEKPSDNRDNEAVRQSIKIQAILAEVGEKMGFKIWLPKSDRHNVLKKWRAAPGVLLESLPLNYNEATIKTIEQIDVLWLRRRSIVRAFEVEHTTSIYSGLLRMADLLALQPNMDIKLHLVAPKDRRIKVFEEMQRPVFFFLEKGPLAEYCSFISYDCLYKLAKEKHLPYLSDKVLENYEEVAG